TSTCGVARLAGAGISALTLSFSSSGSGFVLRHLGYAEQPRNGPRPPRFTVIGAPHFSQLMPVSIGLIGFPSASTSLALRHLGYAEHARNGPRGPSRSTIGALHLSQTCSVGRLLRIGLPSALMFMVVLHSG